MTVLGDNIRRRIKELHISQEEVARQVGISQVALHKIIVGKTKTTGHIVRIASVLGCTAEELSYGESKGEGEVSEPTARRSFGKVPLISAEIAQSWDKIHDAFPPDSENQYIFCPPGHGPRSYALNVSDDSMTSTQGKSYPRGSVIFVDPDQVSDISPGDQVIARLNEFPEIVFKKYVREGSKQYLQSLNQIYDPIYDEFEIIGKVIGKYEEE